MIDLQAHPDKDGFLALLDESSKREIRILGVEGADPDAVEDRVPFLTRDRTDIENPSTPSPQHRHQHSRALAYSYARTLGTTTVHSEGRDCCGLIASGSEIVAAGCVLFIKLYAEEFWRGLTEAGHSDCRS